MNVIKTKLDGVLIIEPKVFGDERGFFYETFHAERYKRIGINEDFVQDNRSRSSKGVLRGLHFQKNKPQGKLVTVTSGEVFDVAVDLRPNSRTFGQYESILLSGENKIQFYVPPGFAHGFCVLSDSADFQYKCTDFYDPSDEGGVLWNDETINIQWPIKNPNLSAKDKVLPTLKEIQNNLLKGWQ
ncbi:dTDP-4-dehydrorhamnose 3,5-epimerase [Cedecea davisae]|uniref:dTDP-4-dehydrorhamnose 3,5-epimerase n=1 Tax=Cedecea davisae DSM 4568 TaxID=566551 RepID=S3ITY8_9ENTR|nr:dTDP-4-dehydrorhamnose 3,5-epimerase [Cedecea davisae]EPF16016.1 dTDP-4-dehydrorhamnose 3,5-epimerase [Cedecea davisae DSM 4568]SUX38676.1 dTDP-4-dehydrorhamnose 3,5-epimerase [Cedecea davisae]